MEASQEVCSKARGAQNTGIKVRIKTLLLKNPNTTADEIEAELKRSDIPASHWTVEVIRAEFRHTLRVMADAGLIKIEM